MQSCLRSFKKNAVVFLIIACSVHVSSLYGKILSEEEVQDLIAPYLLSKEHPARLSLDRIFQSSRAILSVQSMKKAGFIKPKPRKWTHLIVTKHPSLPGLIFKVYLDSQRNYKKKKEHVHWIRRIEGAKAVALRIADLQLEQWFKVPRKWIYRLPETPSPPKEFRQRRFILVEEDMDIFEEKTNKKMWKSACVTKEKLQALYALLEGLGLRDCAKPDNVPFSKDGKIAFIDTETKDTWPVLFKKLLPFLSKEMQMYWKELTAGAQ